MGWIKSRFSEALSGTQPISKKLAFLLLGVVAVALIAVNSLTGATGDSQISLSGPGENQTIEPSAASVSVNQAIIFVHVIGEVKKPGIYELEAGSRVFDAVFAAGGLTEDAEQATVNLARSLTDGEQIHIGAIGEAPINGNNGEGQTAKINLNRSSQVELESLPGVGPALAGRIIDYREQNGGFQAIEDLKNVGGIGDKLFAGLMNEVTL